MTFSQRSSTVSNPVYISRLTKRTVVPEKVTAAPVFNFDKSIELEAGAEIPDKTMFEHDATAAEIEA